MKTIMDSICYITFKKTSNHKINQFSNLSVKIPIRHYSLRGRVVTMIINCSNAPLQSFDDLVKGMKSHIFGHWHNG